ncbi:hypothetical protein LTR66_006794 [Elasticomyces elasticus]|nr:hypothetical protein LTR66_006794 [Elasticomyces elasticus]
MSFFKRLSDSFWGYVSPRKAQAKRDKPLKAPLPSVKAQPGNTIPGMAAKPRMPGVVKRSSRKRKADKLRLNRSMSPLERVRAWDLGPPPLTSSSAPDGCQLTHVGNETLVPNTETDLEGDTLMVDESAAPQTPHATGSPSWYSTLDIDQTIVVPEDQYEELTASTKKHVNVDAAAEERHLTTADLLSRGWDESSSILVQKISLRGFEPLLPKHWSLDFNFLPTALFTADIKEQAFIESLSDKDFRATKALTSLIELGYAVRDKLVSHLAPEALLERAISQYIKWSEQDAGFNSATYIPVIAIETGDVDTPTRVLQDAIRAKLEALADQWANALRIDPSVASSPTAVQPEAKAFKQTPPTLYGIVITHTLVAVVAYLPMQATPALKTVAIFDFGDADYNVWNELAVAILVCHARNVAGTYKDILEEVMGGAEKESKGDQEDPDA